MHIALGYRWFPTAAGYHLEQACRALGHMVTYVGLAGEQRPGFDSSISIAQVIASIAQPVDFYLWIDPAGRYFPSGIEDLAIPTACYLIDVHLGTWRSQVARFFDLVFVAQKDYVETFRKIVGHDQVYWLPLAAASQVHRQIDLPKIYEVGFVGNISTAHRYTPRTRRLELLARHFKSNNFFSQYTPEQVGQIYSQSQIVFNTSIAGDVTMRIFEGTACGALVLTDSIANGLGELFNVGEEIVIYKDDDDLLNQITYYLEHPDERTRIAQAGHQRTWSQHTYTHRVQKILETLTAPTCKLLAPMRNANSNARRAARREIYTHLHMVDAILDESRAAQTNVITRTWEILPVLLRRLLR